MGTSMFHGKGKGPSGPAAPRIAGGNLNMMARAESAPMYGVERDAGAAAKDLAAAAAFGRAPGKPLTKSPAADAAGPKV